MASMYCSSSGLAHWPFSYVATGSDFLKVLPTEGAWAGLHQPVVTETLWLGMLTSFCSLGLALLLGTPLACLITRYLFPGAAP